MTMHKVAYVAGPIAGHAEFNEPLFRAAERRLTSPRNQVSHRYDLVLVPHDIPPFRHEGPCPPSYTSNGEHTAACYLRTDLSTMLAYATDVWFLPGWEASVGARLEIQVAAACGLALHFFDQQDLGCAHTDYTSYSRCDEASCWNYRKPRTSCTPGEGIDAALRRPNEQFLKGDVL